MKRTRRWALLAASTCLLAGGVAAVGCSSSSSDDSALDLPDASAGDDATTSNDAGGGADGGGGGDTGADAARSAHVVFVTAQGFTGDLVGGGGDAGAPDSGTDAGDGGSASSPTAYLTAADGLCQQAAKAAGLPGTFEAILRTDANNGYTRFLDSDGPWALVDGTPVAESALDLTNGRWHASIDKTETGGAATNTHAWSRGLGASDCQGWTSSSSGLGGLAGQVNLISPDALGNTNLSCSSHASLYCAEVGSGGPKNAYPSLPAGAKLAFVTDRTYPAGFTLPDAGLFDGGAPDAGGDAVHSAADALCNEAAAAGGRTGTFRAWIASSNAGAATYFGSHNMNGPWFRPDGLQVAASLTDLASTGVKTQIALGASGAFATTLQKFVFTGTADGGAVATNCNDYSTNSPGPTSAVGLPEAKGTQGLNFTSLHCDFERTLYCFEQ